ncbi:LuxR family transcriptional regulator [Acrocarpospora phusangensis]|uniref:LuxR family transcriptional regulator n=1 Tax=Acrocarpospora phusangensis TaxID=1070424 RepID=A0A919Q9Q0_9ACTN|nr:LuxR family transcriptional regulator [Acrocarpospora phusangensis]GIH22720.1 LuxR family transcriptional regulator [Acrocarpospora phusangensis]
MELWERSAALASLEEALRASAGGGQVVLVAGEAGIGKSALVNAFAARCAGRVRVLWGVCDPLVTPRALGPLHDIGWQAGGRLAARLDAGVGQAELFAALIEELSGPVQRPRPVVVVEDAHWADEATLDLLVFVARRIERLAALLVVTYRDDEVGAEHPLRAALAAMPRHVVREVPVAPLSRRCVSERAAGAGRDPDEVYRLTGGNPLLVTELLAVGGPAVPGSVRDLVLARLRGLTEPAREVARLVAVMPTRAEPLILTGTEDLAEQCVAAGVLVAAGDGVGYRHELLRRAVEDSLLPSRRAALHRRALERLAGAEGVDAARLMHHARLGGDADAVLRYGLAAAADAAAKGAHREAAAHFRAVVPHAGRLPAGERAGLLEAYAFEAYLAGVSDEAMEARRAALAERERLGERERVGENLRWISRLASWSGRREEAVAAAVQAVEVLREGEPGRELAMAYSNRSQLHMLADEREQTIEWGQRARDLAGRLGDRETEIHASVNVATARLCDGDLTAAAALRQAHDAASAAGLVDHAGRALVNLASSLVGMAEYASAEAALNQALRYASENDLDGYVQYLLGMRAGIRVQQCAWDAALADAEESLARPSRIGVSVVTALVARGRILAARGDPGAPAVLDQAAGHASGIGELQCIAPVAAARAQYFLLAGDAGRAAEEAREGLALAVVKGHTFFAAELAYRLWRAGEPSPVPPESLPVPYRLMVGGDWAGAAAEWARRGGEYARVEALSAGDRPAVSEALRILDDLGAVAAARRLRAELRGRGVTGVPRGPRPSTAANAASLTPRQAEVLGLLAEGLSNSDIALRLTLSPKTVEHHISAVLDKLNAATRGQAVATAHRLNLVP